MTLSIIDIIIIFIYFAVVLLIGFFVTRGKNQAEADDEFILAGRKLTLPFFVASLVATWYGSILGIGEFVYTSGIVAWVCFGLPYYIAAALFGFLIAGKIRSSGFSSIPDQITHFYGKSAGKISSIIILVITIPAAYILMLGVIIQLFTGWLLWIGIIAGALLSLAYLFTGGFRADVFTNTAQFIIMYIGFTVLLIFSVIKFGGFQVNFAKLPLQHLTLLGNLSWQYVLAWYVIAFQTFVDPAFHQRCAAARTPKIARRGIFVSIILWTVFDFLTLATGLYAKANLGNIEPLMAFPLLGEIVLPVFWKGIFVVSLLAVIMSTLDSYAFISAFTIGKDFLRAIKLPIIVRASDKKLTQAGLLITAIVGVAFAIWIPSAIELIYKTSSVAVPGLIVPLTLTYFDKKLLKPNDAVIVMIGGSLLALIFTIGKEYGNNFFLMFEPMFPAIIFAVLISLILIYRNKS